MPPTGGAIAASESVVNIDRSVFRQNSATGTGGAIRVSAGGIVVTNSTLNGNSSASGGALEIEQFGSYGMISNSSINGNSAANGGGIYSTYLLQLTNVTLSGNTASGTGGGLSGYNIAIISSSTITANSAPAGQGGGALCQYAAYDNSIVAGNSGTDLDVINGDTTTLQSRGYNLIGLGSGMSAFTGTGDQVGMVDPLLSPLRDNGGPTLTHAPLLGSPALDKGKVCLR